jgi:hypothetical protein
MELALVAPELRGPMRLLPPLPLGSAVGCRAIRALGGLLPAPGVAGVALEVRADPPPGLRLYRPAARHAAGTLLCIHGGGMVIGGARQNDRPCAATARGLGIVVVSVEYRLAPEHPFPAPLDNCLSWLLSPSSLILEQSRGSSAMIQPRMTTVATTPQDTDSGAAQGVPGDHGQGGDTDELAD